MTTYCEATHPNAPLGCYGPPDHEGKHWRWESDGDNRHGLNYDRNVSGAVWEWANEDDRVVEAPEPVFTQAEVGILLTCLQPVTQFFPELVKKLEGMK